MTDPFARRVLGLFEAIHPLDRVARAGYVLRGVTEPESVAAHSHFVALLTLLVCDAHPGAFDKDKAVTMALIHDLAESQIMDIPAPSTERYFKEAKRAAEQAVTERLLDGIDPKYGALHGELAAGESAEARLVLALDRAQMLIKTLMYQREGRGRLGEFWENPRHFEDYGLAPVSRLFDAICAEAGVVRPP